jgi:hypothetical protein
MVRQSFLAVLIVITGMESAFAQDPPRPAYQLMRYD